MVATAVKRASELLEAQGLPALAPEITPHDLRRTCVSAQLAAGWDVPRVMAHVGHATHSMTLSTYGKVLELSEEERAELRDLVEGQWAQSEPKSLEALELEAAAPPPVSAQEQGNG